MWQVMAKEENEKEGGGPNRWTTVMKAISDEEDLKDSDNRTVLEGTGERHDEIGIVSASGTSAKKVNRTSTYTDLRSTNPVHEQQLSGGPDLRGRCTEAG